jgi:hypothetical protein
MRQLSRVIAYPVMVLGWFCLSIASFRAYSTLEKTAFRFLFPGIFVVWLPTILFTNLLTRDFKQKDLWKAGLRGCPAWMRTAQWAVWGLRSWRSLLHSCGTASLKAFRLGSCSFLPSFIRGRSVSRTPSFMWRVSMQNADARTDTASRLWQSFVRRAELRQRRIGGTADLSGAVEGLGLNLPHKLQEFSWLILIPGKHVIQILVPHVSRHALAQYLPEVRGES